MKLLNNKYVLYFVALLALLMNLGNLMMLKFDLVILFAIVALIAYYYTKNMIIVLTLPILAIVLYRVFMALLNTTEGFKEGATTGGATRKGTRYKTEKTAAPTTADSASKSASKSASSSAGAAGAAGADRKTSKTGFENKKLNPKLIDSIPSKKKLLDQVGEVDKIEKAYDSLDTALGENSIRSINGATSELIKEQKEMLSQIKDITPTLEKALQNVSKIDLDKVLNTFNSMSKSMKTS